MLEVCSTVLILIMTYLVDCMVFKKVLKSKCQIFTIKNMAIILTMSLITTFIEMNYFGLLRMVICNIQSCILLKLIFNESIIHTIIFIIVEFLISTVAEMIFVFVTTFIFQMDAQIFIETIMGKCICNVGIVTIYFSFFQIKCICRFTEWIVKFYRDSLQLELFSLMIFIIVLLASIAYPVLNNSYSFSKKITFYLIFIAFIYFIVNFFYQRSRNGELKKEYSSLLEYVKEYEKALEEKGKSQHEYKNQLMVIKGMVNKRNVKLHKYIDDILDISENREIHILNNLKYIPTGGLKGLIYYKLEHMIEKNMEVHVNVDSALESKKYWRFCEKNLQNVSTIVGIYLDNAIEAAEKAEKKFVIIDIDSEEDNLIFSFSNTYEGHIDVGRMDKQGYSTKGKSRGYGLSLVQDILNKNSSLKQKREINGIFYVQKLIIQNKK